jgi:hypothetical protein
MRAVNTLPALGRMSLGGHKSAVEVGVAVHAADNLGDLDRPHAQVRLPADAQAMLNRVERKKAIVFAKQKGDDLIEKSSASRP